jgi:hypothetical protein
MSRERAVHEARLATSKANNEEYDPLAEEKPLVNLGRGAAG